MRNQIELALVAVMVCGAAIADVSVYNDDFSGSVGTDYIGGVANFAYGYKPSGSYKALDYGVWGAANAAQSFTTAIGIAMPNPTASTTAKSIGTFIDTSGWAAYDGKVMTLHFDIVADTGGVERNARAFVYEASGYDTTGANDWHFKTDAALNGSVELMDNLLTNSVAGGATVTRLAFSDDLVTAVGSTDNTLTFTYTHGREIGLAFGSYNTNMGIDNVSITVIPEPATLGMIAAFGMGILFIRRRLML